MFICVPHATLTCIKTESILCFSSIKFVADVRSCRRFVNDYRSLVSPLQSLLLFLFIVLPLETTPLPRFLSLFFPLRLSVGRSRRGPEPYRKQPSRRAEWKLPVCTNQSVDIFIEMAKIMRVNIKKKKKFKNK